MFTFSLDAQVNGPTRSVSAEPDGFGIVVRTNDGVRAAHSWGEAIRIAREDIGPFLGRAQRDGLPWGLRVSVPDGVAVYGKWPLAPSGPPSPSFQQSPLSRIHDRWDRSGPLSALENAIAIIREYAPRGRAAA